ncbi:hypothetical protein QBC39DRAFT_342537 [Podospora conica]|nr:hypothetical protein QBC39DRAFT_342537 [Schizothecium conicum]
MRVTTLLLAGFAALATAQSSVSVAPSAQSSEQAAITRCLAACNEGDVDCSAKCISVPNPNENDANATNKCVAECPQGKGSEAENLAYADCITKCINTYFYTITAVGSQPTGTTESGSGSGSGTTGTGAAPAATTTAAGSAAVGGAVVSSAVGLMGLLVAVLAL